MRQNNIIEFENVTFKYEDNQEPVLDDLTFHIKRGCWTSIVGHNGSGKSTIAKLIMGINEKYEGTIKVNNLQVSNETIQEIRKNVGIVFQNPDNQFVGSTVEYDVAFGMENQSINHDVMHKTVDEVLSEVGMFTQKTHEPSHLSGGQKQRVAIAGILAMSPDIIILDEATAMLDPEGRENILTLIKSLQEKHHLTIVSITHDLEEAINADEIIVLNKRKVYKQGTPQEIFEEGNKLLEIGLDLPFAMKMYHLLTGEFEYVTFEQLVNRL